MCGDVEGWEELWGVAFFLFLFSFLGLLAGVGWLVWCHVNRRFVEYYNNNMFFFFLSFFLFLIFLLTCCIRAHVARCYVMGCQLVL